MTRPRLLTLLGFMLGGLALLGLDALLAAPARTPLRVHAPSASPQAIERAIDDAILLELGLTLPWRADPLIRDRLRRTIGLLTTPTDPTDDLDRAETLGLLRSDPLVRARLVERARRALPEPDAPSDTELAAFVATHADRFTPPVTLTFEHRFAPHDTPDRHLPELTLGPRPTRTVAALARTLGQPAADAIAALPLETPATIPSPIGLHHVRVVARTRPPTPPLSALRPQALELWRTERRAALHRAALDALRQRFAITLVVAPPAADSREASR